MSVLSAEDQQRVVERFGVPARSTVRRLVGPDADDDAWLAARRWRVGASELSAVCPGVRNPHSSAFALWWAKTLGWQLDDSMAMRIGRELEPVVGKLFAEERPDLIVCRPNGRLYARPGRLWLCATPDFLAVAAGSLRCECTSGPVAGGEHTASCVTCGGTGFVAVPVIEPVETKTDEGGPDWGKPGTDAIPAHHRVQLMAQCAVFGATRGHLVRMAGKRLTAYTVDFEPNSAEWMVYLAAGRGFWASLTSDEPPDVDGSQATEDALARLHPALDDTTAYVPAAVRDEYRASRAALALAKEHAQEVLNRLRLAMGDSKFVAAQGEDPFAERRVFKNPGYTVGPHPVDGIWPKGKG